jgi:hypothetical protein
MPQLLEISEPYLRALVPAASAQLETPSVQIQPTHAVLLQVEYNGRIFRLNEPIYLTRYAENGYIYLESKRLSIIAHGTSPLDAVNSFQQDFSMLWDAIAECHDESLTPEATKVKAEFRRVVNAVASE